MNSYDPDVAPIAAAWNALDEQERIILVESYHRDAKVRVPKLQLHAAIHVIVENQLALGVRAVVDAIQRLRSEGLDRHDALHAVGSVLIVHMQRLIAQPFTAADPNPGYERDLNALTAASWLLNSREHR